MLKIMLRGLRGQRRDAALLAAVLVLSFLFLSLTRALSDSVSYTRQLKNEVLFGRHQALYIGNEAAVATLSKTVDGVYAGPIIGTTTDAQCVGVMDTALQQAGGFRLREGTLPQAADEILLVGSRMGEYVTGDRVQVVYEYSYLDKPMAEVPPGEAEEKLLAALDRNPVYRESIARGWDEIFDTDQVRSSFEPEARKPYAELSPEQRRRVELRYAVQWVPELAYNGNVLSGGELLTYDTLLVRQLTRYSLITLAGEAYGEDMGLTCRGASRLKGLMVYAEYTVSGVLEDYTSQWSAAGLSLPVAFVGEAGAAAIEEVQRDAETAYPHVRPQERSALALFYQPETAQEAYFSEILQSYQALLSYRLEGVALLHGVVQGYLVGLDPETGEEVSIPITGSGTEGTLTSGYLVREREGYREYYHFYAEDLTDPSFRLPGLEPIPPAAQTIGERLLNNTGALQFNFLTYPPAGDLTVSTERLLTGVLILVASCASFQVYLQSLRRRSVRIQTLIALGATDGQVVWLLLSEVIVLLLPAAIVGIGLGLAIARIIVTRGMSATFATDNSQLAFSAGFTAGAVLLGTLLPICSIFLRPKRRKAVRVAQGKPGPVVYRYRSIARRYARVNRRQLALQTAILLLTAVSCLLPLFLGNRAYEPWREAAVYTGRPDYELTLPYAAAGRYLDEILAACPLENSIAEAFVSGNNLLLAADSVADSTVYRALEGRSVHQTLENGESGVAVRMLASDWDSALVQGIVGQLPAGTVSQTAFDDGSQCILLAPRYRRGVISDLNAAALLEQSADLRAGAVLHMSYLPIHIDYEADTGARAGMTLTLTGTTQIFRGGDSLELVTKYNTTQTQVAAVVSTMERSVWPCEAWGGWMVLGGRGLLGSVYPRASDRMSAEEVNHFRVASELFYPDCYGETYIQVRLAAEPVNLGAYEAELAAWARNYGMEITNYRWDNALLYTTGQQAEALFLMLGASVALIAVTLLGNLYAAELEQGRRRLGILQACGMTGGQFLRGQWASTMGRCAAILLALHAFIVLFWCFPAGRYAMEGYRWGLHAVICAVFLLGMPGLQLAVSLPVLRRQVVENLY